ncbi:MAG: UPF0104 family protein [Alphaproteobacteria bacterium]|nr:UPF0104 family protein [Alphaproteobacteria bacterium]
MPQIPHFLPLPNLLRAFLSKRPLLISVALTLAFLGWLAHVGLLSQWQQQLGRVTPTWWAVMAAGMLLSYGLRAWRIRREFADVTGMRWPLALRIVLAHTAMVNVLPMRSGELGFPWLMRRALNVPWLDASASLFWLRLQDAMVLAQLAIWLWPGWAWNWRLAFSLMLLASAWWGMRRVRALGQGTIPTVASGLWTRITHALAQRGQNMLQGWAISISNWVLKLSLQAWLLAQLLQQDWSIAWAGALGAELSALSPIQGLAGLGSFEAGSAAALRWHGVAWADGLQAALTLHLVMLACSVTFGLLAWWLPSPLVTRHNQV